MADNFTKFSFLIKNVTKKEVAWLEEVLAYDFEDEQQRPFLWRCCTPRVDLNRHSSSGPISIMCCPT